MKKYLKHSICWNRVGALHVIIPSWISKEFIVLILYIYIEREREREREIMDMVWEVHSNTAPWSLAVRGNQLRPSIYTSHTYTSHRSYTHSTIHQTHPHNTGPSSGAGLQPCQWKSPPGPHETPCLYNHHATWSDQIDCMTDWAVCQMTCYTRALFNTWPSDQQRHPYVCLVQLALVKPHPKLTWMDQS